MAAEPQSYADVAASLPVADRKVPHPQNPDKVQCGDCSTYEWSTLLIDVRSLDQSTISAHGFICCGCKERYFREGYIARADFISGLVKKGN
jgi:hypothetical protein